MGTFHIDCQIENHTDPKKSVLIKHLLVDTGTEFSWIPADKLKSIGVRVQKKDQQFLMANGSIITRNVGFAIFRIAGRFTIDEVVFAEEGDLALLGARTLDTLNPARKKLVVAGPLLAA